MERNVHFVGQSTAFLDAVERASRAAGVLRPVLVVGERGTGKELIAQRLHHLSPRWDQALVTLNCATLPESLIEAELFGHEAGAFTGAVRARVGRFEEADGGTLFLDELGALSMAAQERLLRAIEYGEVVKIGSSRPITVDVRIVAATNADLPQMVAAGAFRADLLDRLSFEVVTLPPLRVREGDVRDLAEYYGRRMASELEWEFWPGFSVEALEVLEDYPWPGNVRELKNVVERAVYRWGDGRGAVGEVVFDPFVTRWAGGESSSSANVPDAIISQDAMTDPVAVAPADCKSLRETVEKFEREVLVSSLNRLRWNQRKVAGALGLTYDQLRHALKRHGLRQGGSE